ncbi:MAG: hypothetical protein ACP5P1_06630 [Acidimicrobiales bacterium]
MLDLLSLRPARPISSIYYPPAPDLTRFYGYVVALVVLGRGLSAGFDSLSMFKEAVMVLPRTYPQDRAAGNPLLPTPGVTPKKRGPGAAILLVLAPLLCCGGPLILAGLATASAATLGTVGAVIGVVLVAAAVLVWVRRRRQHTLP